MKADGISIGVVILAAGASSRMGEPKLLLPWAGTTILGHIVKQWRQLNVTQIAPVIRSGDLELEKEWVRLGNGLDFRIINAQAEAGMFSSVQAAAKWTRWKKEVTHFVVALGDQPQISPETLTALIKCASEFPSAVCQPSVNGRPKHPVVLPAEIFYTLATSRSSTLRDFLEQNASRRRFMECVDPGLEFDLDTPEDYANAVQRFAVSSTEIP